MIMDFVIMDGEVARKGEPPQTTKKQQFTPSTTQTKVRKILGTIGSDGATPAGAFFHSTAKPHSAPISRQRDSAAHRYLIRLRRIGGRRYARQRLATGIQGSGTNPSGTTIRITFSGSGPLIGSGVLIDAGLLGSSPGINRLTRSATIFSFL
jgi:hypothetical protein